MRNKKNANAKLLLIYILLSLGLFAFSVIISIITRMFLVGDHTIFNFSESQAVLVTSMIEGIVGALSAGIVVYQLKSGDQVEEHQNDIEEAKFILQYNQAFVQDNNMCMIEQKLEQEMIKLKNHLPTDSLMITDDNRQTFINYLVYLEGFAPLVLRGVIQLEHIDDLMAYRFFLAMNNPILQEDQLKIFPEYYRGCFKLYREWKKYRIENGSEILNEEYSLDKWDLFDEYAGNYYIKNFSENDDKESVAKLIYNTDRYIYPTAFNSIKTAKKAMPELFEIPDNPYNKKNITVAKINGEIAGVIVCYSKKPQRAYNFEDYYSHNKILPKRFLDTAKHYFNTLYDYIDSESSTTYIACLCVDEKYRGLGIGKALLKHIKYHSASSKLKLHVLSDNQAAIKLYEKCGFVSDNKNYTGYSYSKEKPNCRVMICDKSQ